MNKENYHKEYYEKNKDKYRKRHRIRSLKVKYNLTEEEYDALYKKQDYRCSICNIHENETTRKKLVVDHCHTTGNVRGLLCNNCNSGLGMFYDDVSLLIKAKKYLTENP